MQNWVIVIRGGRQGLARLVDSMSISQAWIARASSSSSLAKAQQATKKQKQKKELLGQNVIALLFLFLFLKIKSRWASTRAWAEPELELVCKPSLAWLMSHGFRLILAWCTWTSRVWTSLFLIKNSTRSWCTCNKKLGSTAIPTCNHT